MFFTAFARIVVSEVQTRITHVWKVLERKKKFLKFGTLLRFPQLDLLQKAVIETHKCRATVEWQTSAFI